MENDQNKTEVSTAEAQQGNALLPHSVAVLVTGILAIQFIYPGFGFVLAIVSLALGKKSKKYLLENPGMYSTGSVKMYRAGRKCAIIGLILSALCIIGLTILIIYAVNNIPESKNVHHSYYDYV